MMVKQDLIKVLFITHGFPPADIGGAERQAFLQAKYLIANGNKVEIVCQSQGLFGSKTEIEGIRITRISRFRLRKIGSLLYLLKLGVFLVSNGRKFDVFHVHIASLHADLTVLIAKLLGIPVHVKVACGGQDGEIKRFKSLSKITRYYGLRHAASVQAISKEIRDELIEIGVNKSRVICIPNGVEIKTSLSSRIILDDVQIPEKVIFLYLGRIASYKGLDLLIEGWKLRSNPNQSELHLVGPIALDKPIVIESDDSSIVYCGPTNNPAAAYKTADAYVSFSMSEGMSNSMMEAMAAGLPIISTNVGAAAELVDNEVEGLLVEPRNIDDLVAAINWMSSHPLERETMGRSAAKKILNYNIENIVIDLKDTYHAILESENMER